MLGVQQRKVCGQLKKQIEAMQFGNHRDLLINDCYNIASHSKLSADRRDFVGMTFEVGAETSESLS